MARLLAAVEAEHAEACCLYSHPRTCATKQTKVNPPRHFHPYVRA